MPADQSLIQACIAQNRKAQQQLYAMLLPYLRAVAQRYLRNDTYTMDALQEGFVKIFGHLDKYDPRKAPLKNWAARIVINTCLNYNNRVIGKPTEELIVASHERGMNAEIMESMSDDELLSVLRKMPSGYFEVFNLYVVDGYNHQEIASLLDISEENSRKKLSRAKNWLKNPKNIQAFI